MTIPTIRLIFIFFKNGTADSTKEAITIAVRSTRTKFLKIQINKIPRRTKTARIIVPVDIEI